MFMRFLLLGIIIGVCICLIDFIMPTLKTRYALYKERKERKKREKAFRNRMKKLEIK